MGPAQAGRGTWAGCAGYKRGFMPMSSFTSSNTNQLMPAAGATFTRLGRMPCAPSNHTLAFLHHIGALCKQAELLKQAYNLPIFCHQPWLGPAYAYTHACI